MIQVSEPLNGYLGPVWTRSVLRSSSNRVSKYARAEASRGAPEPRVTSTAAAVLSFRSAQVAHVPLPSPPTAFRARTPRDQVSCGRFASLAPSAIEWSRR
jgi:hypothetical protein